MNKDQKAAVVDEVAAQISDSGAVFAVDYRGISVPQAAELRAKLRDADASFRVVKNSLTERAADKAGAESLRELLDGPTALTFVRGDAAVAAKALNDFARASQLLEFKGGLLDGAALSADEIRTIARMPARDVLNAQFVGLVASPLTGLVRSLGGLIGGLASQLRQIGEQGLVSGSSEAVSPAEEGAAAPTQEEDGSDAAATSPPEPGSDPDPPDAEPEAAAEPAPDADSVAVPEAAAEPAPDVASEPEAVAEPAEPEAVAEPDAVADPESAEPADDRVDDSETKED